MVRLILSLILCAVMASPQQVIVIKKKTGGGGSSFAYNPGTTNHDDTSASLISTTSTINVPAGSLLLVAFGGEYAFDSLSVICGSDTLSLVKTFNYGSSGYGLHLFAKPNAIGGSSVSCTADWTTSGGYRFIAAWSYSGVATSSPGDGSSCNSTDCTALASASTGRTAQNITTTNANDLLVGVAVDWDGGTTHTEANGYSLRLDGNTIAVADKTVSSTGSYPGGNFTTTSSQQYMSVFAAFKLQ